MKSGTPQFVGERLKEAREARGLNALALSQLIGISRQAVSQFENGLATPSPAVMRRIAEVLRLPIHYFLRPFHAGSEDHLFYRSMSSATKAARVRAERRFGWTRQMVRYLRAFINLPAVNYPTFDIPQNPAEISGACIEAAAAATRRHWRLGDGPISNVVLLLENNGTIVARHDLEADTLDAFSTWSSEDGSPFVVLNSGKRSAARSRFDAAHELGHLVLHSRVSAAQHAQRELFALLEDQAHSFASAFLLPEKSFCADVLTPSLDAFLSLKSKWKVSIQAMIMRARDLRLLSAEQERRIWPNLSRRGWRTSEPLDDTLEPEIPRLLRRSVELLVKSGGQTRQDIVFQNALSAQDIEELIGLEAGYLGVDEGDHDAGQPTIIRFPFAG